MTQKLSDRETVERYFKFTEMKEKSVVAKKANKLVNILNSDVINMANLKESLSQGIPDEASLVRQYSWKLIFDFLPIEKKFWN